MFHYYPHTTPYNNPCSVNAFSVFTDIAVKFEHFGHFIICWGNIFSVKYYIFPALKSSVDFYINRRCIEFLNTSIDNYTRSRSISRDIITTYIIVLCLYEYAFLPGIQLTIRILYWLVIPFYIQKISFLIILILPPFTLYGWSAALSAVTISLLSAIMSNLESNVILLLLHY